MSPTKICADDLLAESVQTGLGERIREPFGEGIPHEELPKQALGP